MMKKKESREVLHPLLPLPNNATGIDTIVSNANEMTNVYD